MATLAHPPPESDLRDQSLPDSSQTVALSQDVNGISSDQNSSSQLPSSQLANGDTTLDPISQTPEHSATSSMAPAAVFHTAIPQKDDLPTTTVAKPAPPVELEPGQHNTNIPLEQIQESKPSSDTPTHAPPSPRPIPVSDLINKDSEIANPSQSSANPVDKVSEVPQSLPVHHSESNTESSIPFRSSPPVLNQQPLPPSDIVMQDAPTTEPQSETSLPPSQDQAIVQTTISLPTKTSRERSPSQEAEGPASKRAKLNEEHEDAPAPPTIQPESEVPVLDQSSASVKVDSDNIQSSGTPVPTSTAPEPTASLPTPAPEQIAPTTEIQLEPLTDKDYGDMTEWQQKRVLETLRNLRKAKYSLAFHKPVDPVAMNLPRYAEVITHPMDLGTMEAKLKDKKYASVNEYLADFDLMVRNAIRFNGPEHPVAQNATMMRGAQKKALERVPLPGEAPPPSAAEIKRSNSIPGPPREKRQVSRPSLDSQSTQRYALNNGVPQIRRDSTNNGGRPKREIKKTAPKDLEYPLPKKKNAQIDLAFCQYVLTELKKAKHQGYAWPFMSPVDPVAMQIPDYHSKIQHPMDVSTIQDKFNKGQYQNAEQFEKDWRLMFRNCFTYNSYEKNPVHMLGKDYLKVFDELWKTKKEWIRQNTASDPATPEPESEEEEEEEEEEESEDDEEKAKADAMANIQKQLAELQQQLFETKSKKKDKKGSISKKSGKKTDAKGSTSKSSKKASHSSTAAARPEKKSKPKSTTKPITMKQKQEISNRIGELPLEEITISSKIIKDSFVRIGKHDLARRADEEMEFDIEEIPVDALHKLFNQIRRVLGAPNGVDDHAASSAAAKSHSTPKKKKKAGAMSERSRDAAIDALREQMAQFDQPVVNDALETTELTGGAADQSSGDEEDSGSESEEE